MAWPLAWGFSALGSSLAIWEPAKPHVGPDAQCHSGMWLAVMAWAVLQASRTSVLSTPGCSIPTMLQQH